MANETSLKKSGADPHEEFFARLGQYAFAFGAGAGGLHVSRDTMNLFNEKYLAAIKQAHLRELEKKIPAWEKRALIILELMKLVGRLAAHTALMQDRTTLQPSDLRKAARKIQEGLHADPEILGIDCPPTSDW